MGTRPWPQGWPISGSGVSGSYWVLVGCRGTRGTEKPGVAITWLLPVGRDGERRKRRREGEKSKKKRREKDEEKDEKRRSKGDGEKDGEDEEEKREKGGKKKKDKEEEKKRWDAAHHAALWVPFRLSKMPFAGGEGKEKGSSGCQRLGEGKQKGRSANGDFGAIGAVGAAGAGATRQCWDRNRQTRACSALCN